jgi:oligosaccharyltransferase complex subunit beta
MADHSLILTDRFIDSKHMVGPELARDQSPPVMYSGIGMAVSDDNVLAFKALTGRATAYSSFVEEEVGDYPQSAGADTLLVAAVQTRNNARVVVSGSLEVFSNRLFEAELNPAAPLEGSDASASAFSKFKGSQPSNAAFANAVSAWAFRETGVLRASAIRHNRADGSPPATQLAHPVPVELPRTLFPEPEIARDNKVYRVRDDVVYSVFLEEYVHGSPDAEGAEKGGRWVPFTADDVQMEFVMLDPYIRKTLSHDGKGQYSTKITTPDVYGVYKFRIMYRRVGYTTLKFETQVSVRPFRHDEFDRFIPAAFPYYASCFSMMVGSFIFSGLFLYSRQD